MSVTKYHDNYNRAVSVAVDVVELAGKKYAVISQPELSNRIFPGWWGDADQGEEYMSEWVAPAISQDGHNVAIVWRFDEVKGLERGENDYEWDAVHNVTFDDETHWVWDEAYNRKRKKPK